MTKRMKAIGVGLLVVAVLVVLAMMARSAARSAYEAREERKAAQDSVAVLERLLVERNAAHEETLDSIQAYYMEWIDSLAAPLPELPPTSDEHLALLDTAEMAREVREAMDAVLAENDSLRAREQVYIRRLSQVETLAARMADSLNAYWSGIRAQDMELIQQLRVTVERAVEESDRFEQAYLSQRVNWGERLLWFAAGTVTGYAGSQVSRLGR